MIRPISAQAQHLGGTRRETIAYDKYLDFLALYKNNGSIYDRQGRIVYQGQVKMSFDGSVYYGWFENFSVSESADSPFMFSLSASFTVEREDHLTRSRRSYPGDFTVSFAPETPVSDDPPQTDLDPEGIPDQGSTGFDFSES
ncbi:MAG: hypothetical protein LAT68_14720 [Cyclobacteriaceae bacterium]|nr:hypothetical protein [Cyclobacteriaceae bacterium]